MSKNKTHTVFADQTLLAKQTAVSVIEKMIKIIDFDESLGELDQDGNPVGEWTTRDNFLLNMDSREMLIIKDAVDGMRADIAKDLNEERYNEPFYYGEDN